MTPHKRLVTICKALDADLPDFEDEHTDDASLARITAAFESIGFRVERFSDKFRLDLLIYRDHECGVVEVKQSHYRLHSEYDDEGMPISGKYGVGEMISAGAFVPQHKIQMLGVALSAGFDYAILAYEFAHSAFPYFIPYEPLVSCIRETSHPQIKSLRLIDADWARNKLRREGRFSMPVDCVAKWRGTVPLLRYMANIKKNGYVLE